MPRSPRLRASSAIAAVAVAAATLTTATLESATPATASTRCPTGPDVSGWQHPNGRSINWTKVAGACNTFAIIKATESNWYTNPYFKTDWQGASNAGLYRGAYHFARPALPFSTAVEQADYFVSTVGSVRHVGDLPLVLDLEVDGGLSPASLITWTQIFLDEVQRKTGRTPVIYTYRYFWWTAMADTRALHRYPLWIADYSTTITQPHTPLIGNWPTWRLWQYTASASIPGISGPVDKSRFNGTLDDLATFADGNTPKPLRVRRPWRPVSVHAWTDGTDVGVSWIPNDNGGSLVKRFNVVASPGGETVSVGGRSHIARFTDLKLGTTYTFTVTATNRAGLTSYASAQSEAVTPRIPISVSVTGDTSLWYGEDTTLTAHVTRADTAAALSSRSVRIYLRPAGESWHYLKSLRTSSDGTVSLPLAPTENEEVRFRVPSTTGYVGDTAVRAVTVHPRISAWLSSSSVRLGDSVQMKGRVSPVLAGRTVYRQGYYDGHWHTWATTTISRRGRFSFTIKPTVRTTDVYRVRLPASSSYGRATTKRLYLRVY